MSSVIIFHELTISCSEKGGRSRIVCCWLQIFLLRFSHFFHLLYDFAESRLSYKYDFHDILGGAVSSKRMWRRNDLKWRQKRREGTSELAGYDCESERKVYVKDGSILKALKYPQHALPLSLSPVCFQWFSVFFHLTSRNRRRLTFHGGEEKLHSLARFTEPLPRENSRLFTQPSQSLPDLAPHAIWSWAG